MDPVVVVIIVLVAIGATWAFFSWRIAEQRKHSRARSAYAPRDPFSSADTDSVRGNPRTLKPGDMIDLRGETFAVRGTLHFSQDGYTWQENFIDTGLGEKAWVSVEDDPDLEVVLWKEVRGATVEPGPSTIELDGRRYRSDEAGNARFTSEGTTGLAPSGNMRYHDYSDGDYRLSFEDYGSGGWECARGELLSRSEYTIYATGTTPEDLR